MASLDSRMGQQEMKLRRLSDDTFRAYRWILDNQDKFEGEVFGPPIVTCSITNPEYATAIESLMKRNDFLSFTVQSTSDFRQLQKLLITQLGLSDISIKTCPSLDPLTRPRPNLNLQQLGLDGWAQDYVTGPDYVIASLCENNALRRTPVGLRDISEQSFNELQNTPSVVSWVSGRKSYKVSRRAELGDWAKSTGTASIRPANVWNKAQPIDVSEKKEHEDTIRDLSVRLEQIEEEMKAQRVELQGLNEQRVRAKRETVITSTESLMSAIFVLTCTSSNRSRQRKAKSRQSSLSSVESRKE